MENYNEMVNAIALAMGASWASGINLYATILALGIGAMTGNIVLPAGLETLSNPLVIGAAGLMYGVEFFADKVPGVDNVWDSIHTFIRVPAGAIIAAGAVGDVGMPLEMAALIVGGGMAAATHATKAGSRILINTSPEPVTNWTASVGEDIAVFAGIWAALNHPVLFLVFLVVFILFLVWLLPKLWSGIKKIFSFLFGRKNKPENIPKEEENKTDVQEGKKEDTTATVDYQI